jgi:hypothetical protein
MTHAELDTENTTKLMTDTRVFRIAMGSGALVCISRVK